MAIQYAEMEAGITSRDASMADNAVWLTEQLGPDGRIVLWAHNFHVSEQQGAMGAFLPPRLGSDLVILGFSTPRG